MNVVGLDIGGANLKGADVDGRSLSKPFALWRTPERLAAELRALLQEFGRPDCLAVTMTAELADCYRTKAEGVDHVLRAVEEASNGVPVFVWQSGAEFVTPDVAREIPLLVAAANWHALATWVGRMVPAGSSLLIDVGSTTTDVIPLQNGIPVSQGMTDRERMSAGELVYSGARRTPLCAIAHSVPLGADDCPLAAELFATTLDVYLLLDMITEDETDVDTADGRPATQNAAHARLAHMLCCDDTEINRDQAVTIARFLADVQRQRISGAIDRVLGNLEGPCAEVIVSGSGSFLAAAIVAGHRTLKNVHVVHLEKCMTPELATAACAVALAKLGGERLNLL